MILTKLRETFIKNAVHFVTQHNILEESKSDIMLYRPIEKNLRVTTFLLPRVQHGNCKYKYHSLSLRNHALYL